MTQGLLEVEDLHVWFDLPNGGTLHAVQGVSFSVPRGARLGIVGESGCGKTTTILALMGLLPPTASVSGRVLFDSEDVLEGGEQTIAPHRWNDIAMVFQGAMNAFDPVKRIGEQIVEPMELHGAAAGREAEGRVRELLETVGISPERARSYPHELSGGMRQRAAIAMALACSPRVLLADEPTTALDVMVQAQVLNLLKDLQRDLGLSMIFITHDLSVLVDVCDRISVMYAGKIVEEGPAHDVFRTPKHPYTRALGAAFPEIGDHTYRMAPTGLGGDPPDPMDIPSGCSFHPRCSEAFEACPVTEPSLYAAGEGRRAACLLVEKAGAET
jgi:peptide/nickel transport system ATP-binding protein